MKISFTLNGKPNQIDVPSDRRVIDILREDLNLMRTKEGCSADECGACTILVDGESRLSCLMLAAQLARAIVNPMDDIRASADLRREVAGNLLLRLLS